MGKKMWLAVDVSDGMFPSERAVTLRTAKGEVSCFVAAEKVEVQSSGRGAVIVDVLDYNDDFGLVALPSQQGGKIAKVERTALSLSRPRKSTSSTSRTATTIPCSSRSPAPSKNS